MLLRAWLTSKRYNHGLGFFILCRVYNKHTGQCVQTERSPDKYKVPQWKFVFRPDRQYRNDDDYYVNIVFGTCDDPHQPMLTVNGVESYGCTYNNLPHVYTQKELSKIGVLYDYNKTRINLAPVKDIYHLRIVHV